jgi:hypothetical protein
LDDLSEVVSLGEQDAADLPISFNRGQCKLVSGLDAFALAYILRKNHLSSLIDCDHGLNFVTPAAGRGVRRILVFGHRHLLINLNILIIQIFMILKLSEMSSTGGCPVFRFELG